MKTMFGLAKTLLVLAWCIFGRQLAAGFEFGGIAKGRVGCLHRQCVLSHGIQTMASRSSWSGKDRRFESSRSFGGSGRRPSKPLMDLSQKLRFKKTIKIDPELKVPVSEMNFSEKTRAVLEMKGFEFMTPVQGQSYEPVRNGEDVVARSRTGTGKTFAFGLPLIEKILESRAVEQRSYGRRGEPLILILEPTRELALQVAQELQSICAAHRLQVLAVYGGASFVHQERSIREGADILVATPGRLLDFISGGKIDMSSIRHVVLDEGDTMLEMGFQKAVESIILNVKNPGEKARRAAASALDDYGEDDYQVSDRDVAITADGRSDAAKNDVQMLLFSATMPGWICELTDKHMNDPVFLDAVQEGETRLADTITHYAVRLPNLTNRLEAVTSYVEDLILTRGAGGQTIVFTNTKEEADNLVGSNCFGQLKSAVLHGDIGQNSRQATIRQFKQGAVDVLVATDVAARGLDIAGVDLVVHTGPPNDADTYVHRAGRTGRAGRSGTSIVLYAGSEERRLRGFESALNFRFHQAGPPTMQDICDASAVYATKKLQHVKQEVANQFLPHARVFLRGELAQLKADDLAVPAVLKSDAEKAAGGDVLAVQDVEGILARCMAAISNRNSVSTRSLLTGQSGFTTLQVAATFRNGSSPDNIRDWQRLLSGVLKRTLEMDDVVFGKMAMGRGANRQTVGLVDLDSETAQAVLARILPPGQTPVDGEEDGRVALPPGLSIRACERLPELVLDPLQRTFERRGSSGRGGGYQRQGSGGGGGGSGGRSASGAFGGRSWSSTRSMSTGRGGTERAFRTGGRGR